MEHQRIYRETTNPRQLNEHRLAPLPYYWLIIIRRYYSPRDGINFISKLADEGLDFSWRRCYNYNTAQINNAHLCSSTQRSKMMIMQLKYAEDINKYKVLIVPYEPNTKKAKISFQRDRTEYDS